MNSPAVKATMRWDATARRRPASAEPKPLPLPECTRLCAASMRFPSLSRARAALSRRAATSSSFTRASAAKFASDFDHHAPGIARLNHGSFGATPKPVLAATEACRARWLAQPDDEYFSRSARRRLASGGGRRGRRHRRSGCRNGSGRERDGRGRDRLPALVVAAGRHGPAARERLRRRQGLGAGGLRPAARRRRAVPLPWDDVTNWCWTGSTKR